MKTPIAILLTLAAASATAASAAAAPAAAQSSVTIYGVADAGLVLERGGAGGNVQALSSGVASASRIGFKGKEDLGGGLSASFVLENGNNIDTGAAGQGGLLFGRQAYVALSSTTLGAISAGRQYSPYYKALRDIADPFVVGLAGNAMNMIATTGRVDNSVEYQTPRVNGFSADVLYGFGEVPGDTAKSRTIGASISYAAPESLPLNVVLTHHQRDNPLATARSRSTMLAARYRVGDVTTHASLSHNQDLLARASNDALIGATLAVGQGKWMASAIFHRDQSTLEQHARQLAIGYTYNLSRRTDLYTAYAHISNRNGAAFHVGNATDNGTGTGGFNLGVRHVF
ncbi:putative porin [Duganella sp. 3397]|uniref:porin n=1 Tax=Duganella sp. 3397 TaxID=2817732 RepID=UPI00285BE244|nr:porin [Duganella sp. 3397]MDR7051248.1 putative porin [Duganella sp. 3397]